MPRFAVEHAVFPAISAVAEKQAAHLRQVHAYVERTTAIGGSCGPILALLLGQYEEARGIALTGLEQGAEICDTMAERARLTGEQYAAAEEACVTALRDAASGTLDVTGIRFCEPGSAATGGTTGAPSRSDLPGGTKSDLPRWEDPLGDARRPVSVLQTFTDRSLGRISPGGSDFTKPFSIRAPFDAKVTSLVDRFWQQADAEHGIPGATPLRDQYNLRQMARYRLAYDSGYTRTLDEQIAPGRGRWVEQNMGARTAQAGILVMSTVGEVRKAWGNVVSLDTATDRSAVIADVADGPANTGAIDWARRP